jgi:hypothetical protein
MGSTRSCRRQVIIALDGTSAVVTGRRGHRRVQETYGQGLGSSSGLLLRHVLRSSPLLRSGGRCDVRVEWDPVDLLVRMAVDDLSRAVTPEVAQPDLGIAELDPDRLAVRVSLDIEGTRALEAVVARFDVDELAGAFDVARTEGRASLDLGVLARARRTLGRVRDDITGRRGFVVDVTSSMVCVLLVEDVHVRDIRTATKVDAAPQALRMMTSMIGARRVAEPMGPGRGVSVHARTWFCVHAPHDSIDELRVACRTILSPATSADVHVMRPFPATQDREARA